MYIFISIFIKISEAKIFHYNKRKKAIFVKINIIQDGFFLEIFQIIEKINIILMENFFKIMKINKLINDLHYIQLKINFWN